MWKTVWWFPLLQRKTGWHQITQFVHGYRTKYRWRQWREVILEQSEWKGHWVQTVQLPNGEEIVRHVLQRSSPVSRPQRKTPCHGFDNAPCKWPNCACPSRTHGGR